MRRSAALIPRHATAEISPIALAIEHASKRGLARAMVGPKRASRCLKRKTPVATRLILAAQPQSDGREEPAGDGI